MALNSYVKEDLGELVKDLAECSKCAASGVETFDYENACEIVDTFLNKYRPVDTQKLEGVIANLFKQGHWSGITSIMTDENDFDPETMTLTPSFMSDPSRATAGFILCLDSLIKQALRVKQDIEGCYDE